MPLKYLIIAIAASASLALAQPQAPITWGDWRHLGIGHGEIRGGIALMGDTLVCVSDSFGQGYSPIFCYSHDNGQTFSSWQLLNNQFWFQADAFVCASAGRAFAFCWFQNSGNTRHTGWTLRSPDGGITWTINQPQVLGRYSYSGFASGTQVIYLQVRAISDSEAVREVVISNDGGDTWQPPVIYSDQFYQVWPIAVTQGHIILLGLDWVGMNPYPHAFISDRAGLVWSDFQPLTEFPSVPNMLSIAGDSSSEAAIELSVLDVGIEPARDLYVIRTTDGGVSWETPHALTSGGPIYVESAYYQIFCRGKLWGVLWENYWGEPSEWGGYVSFSANHGKNWYPPSYIGTDIPSVNYSGGQFVNNEIRVYWNENFGTNPPDDYGTVTGLLTPDTLAPIVSPSSLPPDTVEINSQQLFLASITDNDTLSREELLARSATDTVTIPLTWTGTDYMAYWTVPHEGRFFYRIEGEDFWENIGSYPDSGWAMLVTPGWIDKASDFILPPSSFILSVFPNPANGPVTLSLSPDWFRSGPIEIAVFNLLGEAVSKQRAFSASGTIRLANDRLTSGLYFLHVSNSRHSALQKLLILK